MPIINTPIPESAFILVRDRIAVILADELPNQATLTSESYLAASVFTERNIAIDKTEPSLINISLARGEYGLITAISQDGMYNFNIDIYTRAKSNQDKRGDEISSEILQRLTGVCHHILSVPGYRTLGFAAPFIEHASVSSIQFAEPIKEDQASNVFMSRLAFNVRVSEKSVPLAGTAISGFDTTVKLFNTDFGYLYAKPD